MSVCSSHQANCIIASRQMIISWQALTFTFLDNVIWHRKMSLFFQYSIGPEHFGRCYQCMEMCSPSPARWCLPAWFQARQSHDAAVLSVYLEHVLWLKPLREGQHVVGVAVRRINAANWAARESVCGHDDEDLQRGDGRLVLAVPNDPQEDEGRRRESRLPRVGGLREWNHNKVKLDWN